MAQSLIRVGRGCGFLQQEGRCLLEVRRGRRRERRLAPPGQARKLGRGRLRVEEPERAQRLETFPGLRLRVSREDRVRIRIRRATAGDAEQVAEARLYPPPAELEVVVESALCPFAGARVAAPAREPGAPRRTVPHRS